MSNQFPCSCGWARHSLHVEIDPEDPVHQAMITVVTEPDTLRERVIAAWRMLTGKAHTTSEVYLTMKDALNLGALLQSMLYPASTNNYNWTFTTTNTTRKDKPRVD